MNNWLFYLAAGFNFFEELKKLNPFKDADTNIYDLLTLVINTATTLAGLISIAYAVLGGYQYITAAGNPEQGKKAIGTITWSVIGLVIILSANLIIRFVIQKIK